MQIKDYTDYAVEKACQLIAIDSPSGYTDEAADWLVKEFKELGYKPKRTLKGGVTVDLGGKDDKDAILILAHFDTLGGIVREIKENGRLKIDRIGGFHAESAETECCRIKTKFSGEYEGTYQVKNASAHVNEDLAKAERSLKTMEVVIDEDVEDIEDVRALGIQAGDFVCFDPRTKVTASGYIKSRFLDDKLCCGIFLAYAKYLKDAEKEPARRVFMHFTNYEEVGHGAPNFCPKGVTEGLSVDMGCVGEGLTCTEKMVSICAKDSSGPYNYKMVKGLEEAAIKAGCEYAVDVYPSYASDMSVAVAAGFDVRHAVIGPGVYASHGYERSHKEGVKNTLVLVDAYIG